jgi:formate dehydrogenase beta subunit
MSKKEDEKVKMPKLLVPITTGLMDIFKRGDWRMGLKPSYQTKTPACQANCPAGNDIRGWLTLLKRGDFRGAFELIEKTNPFPVVCGFICPHPCEQNCNRRELDEAIAIKDCETIVGWVRALDRKDVVSPLPRQFKERIAIVGSGPAGMSCAWQLLQKGYRVTIFEKSSKIGGMLTQAIPRFRLPEMIVQGDINIILKLGAEVKTNVEIGKDLTLDQLHAEYNAVFIATGAHKSKKLDIPGEEDRSTWLWSGLDILKSIASDGTGEDVKRVFFRNHWRVVVIGGGNTAIDAARSAKKYGSEIVTVVYRRSEEEMPAQKEEVEEAKKEGINFIFLAAPEEIRGGSQLIKEIVFRKMILGEPDVSGRKKPIPTREKMSVGATLIISAIGEEPDLDPIIGPFNGKTAEEKQTIIGTMESQGIFIGGDALTGPSYVAQAIGQGREAAEKIIAYFSGKVYQKPEKPAVVSSNDLNLAYFQKLEKQSEPKKEASRCLSCGLCPQDPEVCKNCWQFCPDVAIEFKNGRYCINLDYCKGCLICSQECPRHVVNIEEEKKE